MAIRIGAGLFDLAETLLGINNKPTQQASFRQSTPVPTASNTAADSQQAAQLSAATTAQNMQSVQMQQMQQALTAAQQQIASLTGQLAKAQADQHRQQIDFLTKTTQTQSDAATAIANASNQAQILQIQNQAQIDQMRHHQEAQLRDMQHQAQIDALTAQIQQLQANPLAASAPPQYNPYYDPTQDPYGFYQSPATQWGHVPGNDDRGFRGGIQLPADW